MVSVKMQKNDRKSFPEQLNSLTVNLNWLVVGCDVPAPAPPLQWFTNNTGGGGRGLPRPLYAIRVKWNLCDEC